MDGKDMFPENFNCGAKYKVKEQDDNTWITESFGKYSWREKSSDNHTGFFLGSAISVNKFAAFKIFVFTVFTLIFIKAFFTQIAEGEKYAEWAETNRIRQIPIVAKRGIIYDRNQKPLVANVPNFYLALAPFDIPSDLDGRGDLMEKISDILGIMPQEIEERLDAFSSFNYQSILIKNNISYEEAVRLEILAHNYPAVRVETGIARQYDNLQSLSHILGYVRKVDKNDLEENPGYLPADNIGKAGIEAQYEAILRGFYGKEQIEVNAMGRQTSVLAKEDPVAGDDIVLTIDYDLQKKTEEVLAKHMKAHGIKRGAVVVNDVNSGEILALVSLPAYNDNIFSGNLSADTYQKLTEDPDKPFLNRITSGEYPSGSIIKPIFAAAALEEGIISENTTFISSGGIKVNDWFFSDWKAGGHGATNVRKALAESVNTFFYIIGGGLLDSSFKNFTFNGLGAAKLKEYAEKFGLNKKLGIDLPNESGGFLPDQQWKEDVKKESWYIGDTYHMAIGQGDVLVTPLQANFWTAVFANGGTLYQPHIVKTILHQTGKVAIIAPKILNTNFIQPKNIEIVRKGLRDGVVYGSSAALRDLNIMIAGKTGTAQWGTNKTPHAWFTGFAPYDNPELAITVLMEEGREGSTTAVPVAKEILWWYFNQAVRT